MPVGADLPEVIRTGMRLGYIVHLFKFTIDRRYPPFPPLCQPSATYHVHMFMQKACCFPDNQLVRPQRDGR